MEKFASKRKSMIKVRGGYSDATGLKPYSMEMQIEEFDDRTRTILSNWIFTTLEISLDSVKYGADKQKLMNDFCHKILSNVFGESNRGDYGYRGTFEKIYESKINEVICNAPYNEVLDIIWYICTWINDNINGADEIFNSTNGVFERESIGYRFVDGQIVMITDPLEIEEIEQAATSQFEGCKNHIKNSLEYLSDRESKDYKNSVKESISAVESICKVITGNESATLGDALNELKKRRDLNPVLKAAFEKFYGYTNDKGGIRHSDGLFVSDVTFEEAKFMLVSCSAFVNYLISEYGKTIGV